MALQNLLGAKLVGKDGDVDTATLSQKKAVGLYFSAHWCGPCRGFTPQLAKAYSDNLKAKGLEVVFISSDRDADAFKGYFGEMPWLALPFADRDRARQLGGKFGVQGIPTLVILDPATGKVITKDGREAVSEDPQGDKLPWRPPSLWEVVPAELIDSKGGKHSLASVRENSDAIGFYFSAHWCPPCRGFTPQLAKTYSKLKAEGKKLEVVFVSSDRDPAQFQGYLNEMPWLAIPFDNRAAKAQLSSKYGVEGIPTLIIVDRDGNTINAQGRAAVSSDPGGAKFPWVPTPYNDLNSPAVQAINGKPALVVFGESEEDERKLIAAVEPVAQEYEAKAKAEDEEPPVLFFYATGNEGVVPRVKELMGLKNETVMGVVDIPGACAAFSEVKSVAALNAEAVRDFLTFYLNDGVPKRPLHAPGGDDE